MELVFFITSGIAVLATIMVITRLNAVHALLYLIVSLLAISVVFFILGAPFAGVLEVIIYAGAIMVLFIFVIMMLNLGREAVRSEKQLLTFKVWLVPLVLAAVLLAEFVYVLYNRRQTVFTAAVIPSKEVGISLFSTYLLGVELAGLMLVAGMIGAYHLGKTERKVYHRFLKGERE